MTSSNDDHARAIPAVLVGVTGMSIGSVLIKSAHVPGVVVGTWRLLLGAIVWHGALRIRKRTITRDTIRRTFVPGVLFGANLAFFYTGVTKTAIAHAEFLGALTPIIITPLAAWQLGERVKRIVTAFGLAALCGIATIITFSPRRGGTASTQGDLLVVCSVLSWCAYLLRVKTVRQTIDTAMYMTGMTTWAAITIAPLGLASGHAFDVPARSWIFIGIMAVSNGFICHGLLAFAQKHLPLGVITVLQLAQPPLSAAWAWVFLNERIRGAQGVGMAVVLAAVAGVAFTSRVPGKRGAAVGVS